MDGTSSHRDLPATTSESPANTIATRRGLAFPLVPPPIVYAVFFGVGLLLDRLLPWSPAWLHGAPARGTGLILLLVAGWLGVVSLGCFRWRRTTVFPHGHPSHLVTNGLYSFSRNPMYVALTAVYCGGAIMSARLWPLVLVPAPLAFVQWVVIPFEEQRLRETFGTVYEEYCRRVRKWL